MRIRTRILVRAVSSILLGLSFTVGAVVARADTGDDLDRAKRRLSALNGSIASREADVAELQTRLNELAAKIEIARSEAERTRGEIVDTQRRIETQQRAFASLKEQLNERAVEAFIGGPAAGLELLLGASTLVDLSDRMEYLRAVQEGDADLANAVSNKLSDLTTARAALEDMLGRQRAAAAVLERDQRELASTFSEQRTLLDEARSMRDEAETLVSRLSKRLQRELAPPPSSTSSGGDGIPGPLFACPVDGPHAYGDTFGQMHVHPGWTHTHAGNDIIAPYGTPIVAPFAGVAVSSSDGSAGLYVTVSGPEGSVSMMHMSSFGQLGAVGTGDVVGYVGETGNASGPHTHFEWHPGGGAAVDPYPQLNEVC